MLKRIPMPCTPENCGTNYYRCGKYAGYTNGGCRCTECTRAMQEYRKKQYSDNRERFSLERREARLANIEAARARDKARREANRELANERTRRWRERNPGKSTEATMRWLRNNPDRQRQHRLNRDQRIDVAWLEDVDPIVVFERDNWTCQDCGTACSLDFKRGEPGCPSVDHIIPLSAGIFRGGFHSYANTQLLCHSCNSKKHDKVRGDSGTRTTSAAPRRSNLADNRRR